MAKQFGKWTITVDGLDVHVTEKAMKNMRMRVAGADAHLEVSVPRHTSAGQVEHFVRSQRKWIERATTAQRQSPMAQAEAASPEEADEWRTIVAGCVPALVSAWEPILGVKAGKLAYRNMRTRWGSCQPKTGRICINVRLALYPPECLEYVVVHELCHLLVSGHGPQFQTLMTQVMPDWKQRRAKLRR